MWIVKGRFNIVAYWIAVDLVTIVISTGSCFYSLLLCSVITRSFDGLTFQIQLLFHKIIFYKIQEMINPTSRLGSERKPFTQSYHVQIAGCNQTILGCSSFNRQKGLNIWNNPSCILESDYKLSALRLPKLGGHPYSSSDFPPNWFRYRSLFGMDFPRTTEEVVEEYLSSSPGGTVSIIISPPHLQF